ncbi:ATP-binding protein [Streptomyces sp. T-3]|nr:ATP-binding protein [Streptomyces sp. T-3]
MTTIAAGPWGPVSGGYTASVHSVCQLLEADATAEKVAWEFVRSTLDSWGQAGLGPQVYAAVGELVANALDHGMSPVLEPPFPCPLVLNLQREGPDLLCAVFDPGVAVPRRDSGLGLRIVEAVSNRWGWTEPGPNGKAVWAAFAAAGPTAVPAPATVDRLLTLVGAFTGSGRPHLIPAGPASHPV